MKLEQALQLHNRDEVQVRTPNGKSWEPGYVLGEPRKMAAGLLIIPVQTQNNGWREVDHTDVR